MKRNKLMKISAKDCLVILMLLFILVLSACVGNETISPTSDLAGTYAAQTLTASAQEKTISAYETLAYGITQTAMATPTSSQTHTPSPTMSPTPTMIPPTEMPTPTLTATQTQCNLAIFVEDISIPDGKEIEPGVSFMKTWRLENIGSCTWTANYDVIFVSGNSMNAPNRIGLNRRVNPGEFVDISILMEAPTYPGTYTGYWMLADEAGDRFGVGPEGEESFWVSITVKAAEKSVYDFAANYCDAVWRSGTTDPLPCPGDTASNDTGYVVRKENPIREDGGVENEAGLVTSPDNANKGVISGRFPAFTVQKGDLFKAVIGCEHDSPGCNVLFELRYRIDGGAVQTLASWHEVYEGQHRSVTVDLSSLAGYEVNFILVVKNNGTPTNNRALWLLPRIMR
jgi:hypothetical protein